MSSVPPYSRSRVQASSEAIQRLYITMRHVFNRGFYKPMGVSGETLRESLFILSPEIYGDIASDKVDLAGLLYVIDRLPAGIEECRFINLTGEEGYGNSHFTPIIPLKRRRNCYRIDEHQMNIEITRGRSEIYDILTHLTFLYIESHKIIKRVLINKKGEVNRDWTELSNAVLRKKPLNKKEQEVALSHTANILGRSFSEVVQMHRRYSLPNEENRLLHLIYWIGQLAKDEQLLGEKRTITFSPVLRDRIGQHIHGEVWANSIKKELDNRKLLNRPIHIISANMHSVVNSLFAEEALKAQYPDKSDLELYELLSTLESDRNDVISLARENGMTEIEHSSGTNINVQIFDSSQISTGRWRPKNMDKSPVIIVMDYAFGEQAYETMDELLKPYSSEEGSNQFLNVESISIMGKAGILQGGKGDVLIPTAHIFEGTADNYPFTNGLCKEDFSSGDIDVYEGAMVTVMGTSLQNKDILTYFNQSTWGVVGLEMEGAHYQKAIQAASKIRKSISPNVTVNYAYYASDNPLKSGSTLASGGLGTSGVKPTYLITEKILEGILG